MKEQPLKTEEPLFRTHKTVSVEEIIAAGGPTIYGIKSGKNNESMIKAMKNAPKAEPFTDEEFMDLMKQLQDTK